MSSAPPEALERQWDDLGKRLVDAMVAALPGVSKTHILPTQNEQSVRSFWNVIDASVEHLRGTINADIAASDMLCHLSSNDVDEPELQGGHYSWTLVTNDQSKWEVDISPVGEGELESLIIYFELSAQGSYLGYRVPDNLSSMVGTWTGTARFSPTAEVKLEWNEAFVGIVPHKGGWKAAG